jgi:hypothetical protein
MLGSSWVAPQLPEKKKVVGLERDPLSLVNTTEELLLRSGSCLENREYGRRDPSLWPRATLYPQKLAITSPTSGGRSVGIVRSRTQTMEFFLYVQVNGFTMQGHVDLSACFIFETQLRFQWYFNHYPRTSPTSGGRSVGIVRSRTNATKLVSHISQMRKLKWRSNLIRDLLKNVS